MTQHKHYVMLRSEQPVNPNTRSGEPVRGVRGDDSLKIETAEVSGGEIARMWRTDEYLLAAAELMPLRLYEPALRSDEVKADAAGSTWGLRAIGATQTAYTGEGIKVAVLDSGIDAGHEAFTGVKLDQRDFTGDGNGDSDGHGTHCAGTIFGRPVAGHRIGVAPGVSHALIGKVLGRRGASTEQLVQAIQWAADGGAHVISMSLGIDFPGFVKLMVAQDCPVDLATSRALEAYLENVRMFDALTESIRTSRARHNGALMVAAAGNESRRAGALKYTIGVSPPANAKLILSVGAVALDGDVWSVAPFSNANPGLAGPGVGIVSARPGGGLATMSGTSMAAPHVAGAAVLWAEAIQRTYRRLTPDLLLQKVAGAAVQVGELGYAEIGGGLVKVPPGPRGPEAGPMR